jgi:hypothetical protein
MNVREIPSNAVDRYLRLLRMPLDGAIALLPGNGTGAKPVASLAVDRADAAVRAVVAAILGEPGLREDAKQRQAAADKRADALRLRASAERKSEQADTRLAEREQQAAKQREQASRQAKARRQEAARKANEEKRRAAKAESQRLDATREIAEQTDEALEDQANKDRLDTLEARSDAVRKKESELAARDEARRLRGATSRTKSERKRS